MPNKVRTAKGKIIDFDLLKIKQQMESAPTPTNVQARQDFIDAKMRRRMKKVKRKLEQAKAKSVNVDKEVAAPSTTQGKLIHEAAPVVESKTAPKKTSTKKRKIKKKTTKKKTTKTTTEE